MRAPSSHAASLPTSRVTTDHPPGGIPRDPLSRMLGDIVRRAALVFLLVLGCGLAAASLVAVWTRVTVLNTDRYVNTMAPIARSPAVQKAVADKLSAKITGAVDFEKLA